MRMTTAVAIVMTVLFIVMINYQQVVQSSTSYANDNDGDDDDGMEELIAELNKVSKHAKEEKQKQSLARQIGDGGAEKIITTVTEKDDDEKVESTPDDVENDEDDVTEKVQSTGGANNEEPIQKAMQKPDPLILQKDIDSVGEDEGPLPDQDNDEDLGGDGIEEILIEESITDDADETHNTQGKRKIRKMPASPEKYVNISLEDLTNDIQKAMRMHAESDADMLETLQLGVVKELFDQVEGHIGCLGRAFNQPSSLLKSVTQNWMKDLINKLQKCKETEQLAGHFLPLNDPKTCQRLNSLKDSTWTIWNAETNSLQLFVKPETILSRFAECDNDKVFITQTVQPSTLITVYGLILSGPNKLSAFMSSNSFEKDLDRYELNKAMELLLPNIWNIVASPSITRNPKHVIAKIQFSLVDGKLKLQGLVLCDDNINGSCGIRQELYSLALAVINDYQQSKTELKINYSVKKDSQNLEWTRIVLAKACTAYFKDICDGITVVKKTFVSASKPDSSESEDDDEDLEIEQKPGPTAEKIKKHVAAKRVAIVNSQCTPILDESLPIVEPKLDLL
jgi:hypothetical protein